MILQVQKVNHDSSIDQSHTGVLVCTTFPRIKIRWHTHAANTKLYICSPIQLGRSRIDVADMDFGTSELIHKPETNGHVTQTYANSHTRTYLIS